MPAAPFPDPSKPYRLVIDLEDMREEDFSESFETPVEAIERAKKIISDGFVIKDTIKDSTSYDCHIYPLAKIRSLRVHKPLMVTPPKR